MARKSFVSDTEVIVAAIARISASISRDHSDPQIQRFMYYNRYRPMIAALCSLVTSTKLAASEWSPESHIRKMERDAQEVLNKAEAFIEYARSISGAQPKRIKPFFMSEDGDGSTGGGWTHNLSGSAAGNPNHLENLLQQMEIEREAIEKCIKAMGLPNQASSRIRKNSIVMVDDHLIIPFVLLAIRVPPVVTELTVGNACGGSKIDYLGRVGGLDFVDGSSWGTYLADNRRLRTVEARLIRRDRQSRHRESGDHSGRK
jgi:hypothetical protein